MPERSELPIAVIGAGPIGLAAAAHLTERGLPLRVYEAGRNIGAHVRDWAHVRVFSPWKYNVDPVARAVLARHGWQEPPAEDFPTGADLVASYLEPLAKTALLASVIETGARVSAIGRQGIDKVGSKDRETKPFALTVTKADGTVRRDLARAVIDASGTWGTPNPLGADGMPAPGEDGFFDRIVHGIPDITGRDRRIYAGSVTAVVGAGHSAATVLLDLARLAEADPRMQVIWVTRGTNLARVFGGGIADQLQARGALGSQLRALVEDGRIELVSGFGVRAVEEDGAMLVLVGETAAGTRRLTPVQQVVVATGQRPDLGLTRELRLDLDPWLESVRALGPLIDPNEHSCGSVRPHGRRELSHPEPGFYTVGVKSYGRAPNFLMLTGYEQVRSVVAALAGDLAAADDVRLVLPETGVCSTQAGYASNTCCGGPAPGPADACCTADAEAKQATGQGCGCTATAPATSSCCGEPA